jgi:hypothetical protein
LPSTIGTVGHDATKKVDPSFSFGVRKCCSLRISLCLWLNISLMSIAKQTFIIELHRIDSQAYQTQFSARLMDQALHTLWMLLSRVAARRVTPSTQCQAAQRQAFSLMRSYRPDCTTYDVHISILLIHRLCRKSNRCLNVLVGIGFVLKPGSGCILSRKHRTPPRSKGSSLYHASSHSSPQNGRHPCSQQLCHFHHGWRGTQVFDDCAIKDWRIC